MAAVSSGADWDAHAGYVHEAVFYDTTSQLVDATAPLLRQFLAQGADVALVCTDANNRALGEALEHDDRLLVLPRPEIYDKAVTAVAYFRDFVQERVAVGRRICILGEVDFGLDGRALDEWRRYETLLNVAMVPFPLWSLCGYDTSTLPHGVLATGEVTHPYLRRNGIQTPNPAHVDSAELMREVDAGSTPVPEREPALTILEVLDFSDLHRQVKAVLLAEGMGSEQVEDVVIAVHEVTTNGLRHGEPPVTVRLWVSPGRVECTVTDRGAGFDDPFVGYLRGGGDKLAEGGYGLWLARRLCDEVVSSRTSEGFTTRLVVHH